MNDVAPVAAVLGVLFAIITSVLGMGIAMLGIYLGYRRRSETLKAYHAERMAAIEKGIELPPLPEHLALTQLSSPERPWVRARRSGLILLLVGLSLMVAMWQMGLQTLFWWGLVPAAIGLALLISSALEASGEPRGPGPVDRRPPGP